MASKPTIPGTITLRCVGEPTPVTNQLRFVDPPSMENPWVSRGKLT